MDQSKFNNRYLIVLSLNEEIDGEINRKYAVVGELGQRYLTFNDFNQYGVEVRQASDYTFLSLKEIYDDEKLTLDDLKETATSRFKKRFDRYMGHIRLANKKA